MTTETSTTTEASTSKTTRKASTPADHAATQRKHHRLLWTGGIVAVAAVIFAVWFFQDPITYYGQRTVQTIQSGRPHVERIVVVPAATPDTVKMTQLANTDAGRVAIIETTETKSDLVDTIATLKKQAADAKELADKAIAEAKAQAAAMATTVKESDALKTTVASLQTAIEKQTAQSKEYLELYKKSQISVPAAPSIRAQSTKPQALRYTGNKLAYEDEDRPANGGDVVGNGRVKFDRTGIPSNWEIRGGDFSKAEKCHGTVYVARKERLPNGGMRNFLGCR